MSTKTSIFYHSKDKEYLHFYSDITEDKLFIEKDQMASVKLELTLGEVCALAKSVDFVELDRQANITDEKIMDYVNDKLQKYDSKNILATLWHNRIFGDESLSLEERVKNGFSYYKKIRDLIQKLHKETMESKVYPLEFGLSDIK